MPWLSAESRAALASSSTPHTAAWSDTAATERGVWPLAARVSTQGWTPGAAKRSRTASSLPSHAAYLPSVE
eukprot:4278164-Prymnesium_polylepis.1